VQHFKVAKVELTLHSCKPETRTVQEYNDLQEIVSTYFTIQRRSTGRPALLVLKEAIQVVDGATTAALRLLMMASTHQFTTTFEI